MTAIIEHNDGRMELIHYEEFIKSLQENADRRVKVSPLAAISQILHQGFMRWLAG